MAEFYVVGRVKPNAIDPAESTQVIHGIWNGTTMVTVPTGFTPEQAQEIVDTAIVFSSPTIARQTLATVQALDSSVQIDIFKIEQTRTTLSGYSFESPA